MTGKVTLIFPGFQGFPGAVGTLNYSLVTCPRRFCPAHTDVCMIFKNNCPVLGLKMKMAPLIGLVVKFPSNVWNDKISKHFTSVLDRVREWWIIYTDYFIFGRNKSQNRKT